MIERIFPWAVALSIASTQAFGQAAPSCQPAYSRNLFTTPVGIGNIAPTQPQLYAAYRCISTSYIGAVASIWSPNDGQQTLLYCAPGGILQETINPLSTTCVVYCTVRAWYNQGAGGNNPFVEPEERLRPRFIPNAVATDKGCAQYSRTDQSRLVAAGGLSAQPLSVSWVAKRTAGSGGIFDIVVAWGGQPVLSGFSAASGGIFFGSPFAVTVTPFPEGILHAVQGVSGDPSTGQSYINVDGVTNTGFGGNNAQSGFIYSGAPSAGTITYANIMVCELAVYNVSIVTSANAFRANQKTEWGTP